MPFEKGNKEYKKRERDGRHTDKEIIEKKAKAIAKMTIEELATDKVYKQLTTLKGRDKKDRQGVKDIAMPVYLKSKVDKSETTVKINTYDKEQLDKIARRTIQDGGSES